MVEIIGIQTEQEAKQIYAEAERKLNERKAEIDRINAEADKKGEIGVVNANGGRFQSSWLKISEFLPDYYKYYELCQKYGEPIEISDENDIYDRFFGANFVADDDEIVGFGMDLEDFCYVEKYNLSNIIVDFINKTIYAPYSGSKNNTMINIIGPTEQEAQKMYFEAERKLTEKNAEIDRENEKRKKVNAEIETFKKWEIGFWNVGGVLIVVSLIFLAIVMFILETSTFFLATCPIMLAIGLLLILGALILESYIEKKYGTIDLMDMLDYYSIDNYLPVAYQYYELCQKYGQPINIEFDSYKTGISLVFVNSDNETVYKHLYLEGFHCGSKYNLTTKTIDLINENIWLPYNKKESNI